MGSTIKKNTEVDNVILNNACILDCRIEILRLFVLDLTDCTCHHEKDDRNTEIDNVDDTLISSKW